MKTALITGVSSGIGLATAQYFLQRKFLVFGSVRKRSDIQALGKLKNDRLVLLRFDITDQRALNLAYKKVKKTLAIYQKKKIDYLINNAGIIIRAPLLLERPKDFLKQIHVNLCGTYMVSKTFLPLLLGIKQGSSPQKKAKKCDGRVIIVNSINGKIALPLHGAYCASKFALIGLAESWDLELRTYGLRVISILPGLTDTRIREKVNWQDIERFRQSVYGPKVNILVRHALEHTRNRMNPEKAAATIYRACTRRFPASSYVITPHPLFYWWLPRLLPKALRNYILKI